VERVIGKFGLRRPSGELRRLTYDLRRLSDELRRASDDLRRRKPGCDGDLSTCDAHFPSCDAKNLDLLGKEPVCEGFLRFGDGQKATVKADWQAADAKRSPIIFYYSWWPL
jgi:hypothetical protein